MSYQENHLIPTSFSTQREGSSALRNSKIFTISLHQGLDFSKIQTPFQGKMSGDWLRHHHLSGKEMLMGSWMWRGIIVDCPVASAKMRLALSWEDLTLLWKAMVGEVKGSSSCLITTYFWLRMTSLNYLN